MSRTVCGTCWSPYIEGRCDCPQTQPQPVAWRFKTKNYEHALRRLTDDAGLVEQMRAMGAWEIRPLVEQE
jgi:hypothetical protein